MNSFTYEYNKMGMKKEATRFTDQGTTGSSDVTKYKYDPLYRIKKVKAKVAGEKIDETQYKYDANGNRIELKTRRYNKSEELEHEDDEDFPDTEKRNDVGYFYSAGNILESISLDIKKKKHGDDDKHSRRWYRQPDRDDQRRQRILVPQGRFR